MTKTLSNGTANQDSATPSLSTTSDPVELAHARERREQFDRNWEWFKLHSREIYDRCRGHVVCIAGQELFVAPTTAEALRLARNAHPDDGGLFTQIIPREIRERIYANHR